MILTIRTSSTSSRLSLGRSVSFDFSLHQRALVTVFFERISPLEKVKWERSQSQLKYFDFLVFFLILEGVSSNENDSEVQNLILIWNSFLSTEKRMRRVREGALRSHRAPGAQLKLKRSLGRLCRTRRRRRRGERGRERNFFFFWNRERWRGGAESLQVPRSSPAHWLFSSFVRDRADWSQMALSKLRWGVPCSAAHDAATPPSHNLFFLRPSLARRRTLAKWEDAELKKR